MTSVNVGSVLVRVGTDSGPLFRDLDKIQARFGKLSTSLRKVGKNMRDLGKKLSTRVTLPIVGFGALMLKTAGDFEAGMNQVAAVSGATAKQLEQLKTQAKELGATTQFSASQAADAMGFLAMAGLDANEVMSAMPGTLQLAAAAQIDLGRAADIVSNVMTGYGMTTEDLTHINDVLVKSFTSANTDLVQLAEAFKYAGPLASVAGLEFEQAAAALSLMGNAGVQASMAGTSLRGAITRILNPTDKSAAAMEELGLKFTDAAGRLLPLDQIVEQLQPHLADAGLFMTLFGQRAGPAMVTLVKQGTDALREMTDELENSGGTAKRIADVQMEGFNGAMKELRSAFEALQIAIAESGLLEFMTEMVRGLAEFIRNLSKTNPELLKWGTIIAAAAAAIGPLIFAVGGLITVMGGAVTAISSVGAGIAALVAVTGPIGLLIAAAAAVVAAWTVWGDDIKAIVLPVLSEIGEYFSEFFQDLVAGYSMLGERIMSIWGGLVEWLSEKTRWITETMGNLWQGLSDLLVGNSVIPDMIDSIIGEFARGQRGILYHTNATTRGINRSYEHASRMSVGTMRTMSGRMQSIFGDLFGKSKAFAIAQALISTYQGIAQALKDVPYPANLAAAALVGAQGIAQVQAIRSTSPGGGGGGGVPSGAGAGAGARSAQPGRSVNITVQGETVGRESIRQLIGKINDEIDDGTELRVAR